ncbi:MAG: 30S ribosomal protein S6 [Patescibacteria group bacterium]
MIEQAKQYQISCLFPPSLNQDQLQQAVNKVKQIITDQGGSFSLEKENLPYPQRLAYPINKQLEAFHLNLAFSFPAQSINQLYQYLNLEDSLLRYIITSQKQPEAKPEKEIDYSKMIEKIEPFKEAPTKKEKTKFEDLDKKLEEILNQ